MPYVFNATGGPTSYGGIYGFRTSSGSGSSGGKPLADVCDRVLTLYDPFIFEKKDNLRWVAHRVQYLTSKGMTRYRIQRDLINYPYLKFKKQTRTLREWREIHKVYSEMVAEGVINKAQTPDIIRVGQWLRKAISRYPKCGTAMFKSPREQHDVSHETVDYSNKTKFYVDEYLGTKKWTSLSSQYTLFQAPFARRRYDEMGMDDNPIEYYPTDVTNYTTHLRDMDIAFRDNTLTALTDSASNIAAILWPSPEDLTDDPSASPLIDIAEAISDGSILGTPPDPRTAFDHLDQLDGSSMLSRFAGWKKVIDFGANSWLWSQLVVKPVVSSAVALSAAVRSNDNRINAIETFAKDGKWIQGKHMRIHRKGEEACFGIHTPFERSESATVIQYFREEYDVEEFETNANFVYKLPTSMSFVTSGQALGLFFNSLSSNLTKVAWNIVPLSFVFDWFSNQFTGQLDLNDKVYLPVESNKLTVSRLISMSFKRTWTCEGVCEWGHWEKGTYVGATKLRYNNEPLSQPLLDAGYIWVVTDTQTISYNEDQSGLRKNYDRVVYENITPSDSSSIPCRSSDPGELVVGQWVTLSALVWSAIKH